ncbi:MAG: hypothetical protein SPK26_15330 [Treponema sp.]|nr:hypothetical protein [Treponema sp.]
MKKIISLIAASTLAFALVSCNGDLHDDTNAPYTDAAQGKETEAYICGGLNGAKFEKMTKNEDGSFSYQYKYNGTDGWGGKEGESHFTIVSAADYDCYKTDGYRWQLPDGVKAGESADLAAYEYDNHIVIKGLTKDAAYKITVNLETKGGKIKVDSAVLPTPFYLNGAYITGCDGMVLQNGSKLQFDFPKEQLLWNPVLTEGSGELLYSIDIEAKEDSHSSWHTGNGVIKVASPGWKNEYGKTPITVGQDFVELVSSKDNAPITGMTAGKAYRIEIKTTPEQKVFAKVYELTTVNISIKGCKLINFESDNDIYFLEGWVPGNQWNETSPNKGNAVDGTTVVDFTSPYQYSFIGKSEEFNAATLKIQIIEFAKKENFWDDGNKVCGGADIALKDCESGKTYYLVYDKDSEEGSFVEVK